MIDQAIKTGSVELHHPVAHDLQRDAADPRRLGACRTIIDRRKRQQTSRLRRIPAPSRGHAQTTRASDGQIESSGIPAGMKM